MGNSTSPDPIEVLGWARTVLLTTFRKTGVGVPTPVWVVRIGDELHVWTNPRSGKFKRIRNNPQVTLVPCTFRGVAHGVPVSGTVRVLEPAEIPALIDALKWKYGLFGRLSLWQSALVIRLRGWPQWSGLAVSLD